MWVPPWAVRRFVLAPLMPVLAAVAVVLFPFVLAGHAALALGLLLRGRARAVRWRLPRAWLFGIAYLVGETACLLACLALWVRFAGRFDGDRARQAHAALLQRFLDALVGLAGFTFRFELQMHEPRTQPGDPDVLHGDEPIIVLARHAGPGASFVLVHILLSRYGRMPRIVLTDRLRWDPAIDVLLSRLHCAFIPKGGDAALDAVEEIARSLRRHDALLIFPEGGDWTPLRHRRAVARLRRQGHWDEAKQAARMAHVLPPRPAGTVAALLAAPHADVVVFGHTGHDDLQDLATVWAGLPLRRELDVLWWREPAAELPDDADEVRDWLFDLWRRIDSWIEEQGDLVALTRPDAEQRDA
ncbi:MAG: hypothetical protein JWM67_957 [Mycobacterium sp.]|nr:hypothetical protein [Mycobacterium sp.]